VAEISDGQGQDLGCAYRSLGESVRTIEDACEAAFPNDEIETLLDGLCI
jgi:hypothetical protein